MGFIISLLIVVACLLLIAIILIQNPKGGGLSSSFGSATQFGGVRKTNDFLDKATWSLSIAIVVLCLASTSIIQPRDVVVEEINPETIVPENLNSFTPETPLEQNN